MTDDDDLTRRALGAYFRYATDRPDQPSSASGVVEHDGRRYVVLHNVTGVLAVFRVRRDGMLKRLRRWPAAVADGSPPPRYNRMGRADLDRMRATQKDRTA
jgi:hypothetical protein